MKKHYETHVEDTDKLISVAGPVLDYKSWYERYRKLMEEQAQRKYGLYTPTSEGDDDFPSIPGMIARWSAKGLTNEDMSTNPVWKDLTGNGYDLQMKNFAWGGMSGCGGYNQNFNQWSYDNLSTVTQTHTSDKIIVNIPALPPNISTAVENIYSGVGAIGDVYDLYIRVTGLKSNVRFIVGGGIKDEIAIDTTQDGIYHINLSIKESWQQNRIYFWFYFGSEPTEVTIEQLPHYPGFIIGDGVDDYAVTEKNLDFEDTYTVYTAFIPSDDDLKDNSKRYGVCGKDYTKDFYLRYSYPDQSRFYSSNIGLNMTLSNGFNLIACKRTADKMQFKNLLTGASAEANAKTLVKNPGLYYLWRSAVSTSYSKAAIAGQVICNGHFTTDEEDTKVLNWYKKEYPWLFFDQAWTVVGKSNEDTDRATIANITGNGNNLVLSNFGFAGNSGYGEYAQNFNHYGFGNLKTITYTRTAASMQLDVPAGSSENIYSNADGEAPIGFVYNFNLKITGLKTGNLLSISQGSTLDNIIVNINKDGVYNIKATVDDSWYQRRIYFWIRNSNGPETTLSIEQIPDHEGYLVTDGVDDNVHSSAFTLNKKFTVVGEWEFPNNVKVTAGIVKPNSFFVYNAVTGTQLFLNNAMQGKIYPTKSLKAFCSDGRVYDSNWVEYLQREEQTIESSVMSLNIGINYGKYAQLALKNIAFFNGKYLSKEDCIKAYIYLQTLKAK